MKFHERKSSFFFVHKKERVFVLSTEYKNRKQNDKENTFPIKMSSYTQCFPFRVIKYTYSMYSSIASKLQLITAIAIKTIDSNPNRCSSNANFRSRDRQWEKRTRGRVEIESQRWDADHRINMSDKRGGVICARITASSLGSIYSRHCATMPLAVHVTTSSD